MQAKAQITTDPRTSVMMASLNAQTPADSPIFNFIQHVRNGCLQVISVIPDLTDEQLRAVHDQSAELESFGWLVRAYARHEFLKRAVRQRGGRSLKDVDEIGRVAMAKRLAVELGISHMQIVEDALIVERLIAPHTEQVPDHLPLQSLEGAAETVKTDTPKNDTGARTVSLTSRQEFEILPEKEYWRVASRSEKPMETLAGFAQQKTENPFFNTRDAYRQEKAKKTPPLDEEVPPLIEDDSIRRWYDSFNELRASSPTDEIKRVMESAYEEIRYEVQRPNGSRLQQILRLIANATDELDLIATNIRQDRVFVGVWLNRMEDDGLIVHFEKERAPGARGAARTGYRLTDAGVRKMKGVDGGRNV